MVHVEENYNKKIKSFYQSIRKKQSIILQLLYRKNEEGKLRHFEKLLNKQITITRDKRLRRRHRI